MLQDVLPWQSSHSCKYRNSPTWSKIIKPNEVQEPWLKTNQSHSALMNLSHGQPSCICFHSIQCNQTEAGRTEIVWSSCCEVRIRTTVVIVHKGYHSKINHSMIFVQTIEGSHYFDHTFIDFFHDCTLQLHTQK